jgi:HEAT repeat protein
MKYIGTAPSVASSIRDLKDRSPQARAEASEALGRSGGTEAERARSALRPMLADESPTVRYAAALSLGKLGDAQAVEPLLRLMREESDPLPRQAAVVALGQLGDPVATESLLQALDCDDPDIRFQAATALSQVNPGAAIAPLRKALRDTDPDVRASAAAALGDLVDRESAKDLAALLEDEELSVRLEAAVALARLDDQRGTRLLVSLLDHRQYSLLAAEHLFRCPDPAALDTLRKLLGKWTAPPLLKVWAAGTLARLGCAEGRETLLSLLSSRKETVRGLSIQLLGALDTLWSRNALEKLRRPPVARDWEAWQEEIALALTED